MANRPETGFNRLPQALEAMAGEGELVTGLSALVAGGATRVLVYIAGFCQAVAGEDVLREA